MLSHFYIYRNKYKYALRILLVFASISLCSLLPPITNQSTSSLSDSKKSTHPSSQYIATNYDSPNVITASAAKGIADISNATDILVDRASVFIGKGTVFIYMNIRSVGMVLVNIGRLSIFATGKAVYFATSIVVNSISGISQILGTVFGIFTKVPSVSAYIRPANYANVPTIDNTFASRDVQQILSSSSHTNNGNNNQPSNLASTKDNNSPSPTSSATQWPLHGQITTLFGVPEWPFQPIHTGIDISSGSPAGITPIKPFRSGRIVSVVSSNVGLGNHIIIDHGGGVTSVYAHMSSIITKKGDKVDLSTVLGFEGSTGASTGPHLHFEVRQNEQPINPKQFFSTLP